MTPSWTALQSLLDKGAKETLHKWVSEDEGEDDAQKGSA